MVLLISYDLNGHERPRAYKDVERLIQQKAVSSIKPLYSQWLVETSQEPDIWGSWLNSVIDENDRLLIVKVRTPYQGWLDKEDWAWLSERT